MITLIWSVRTTIWNPICKIGKMEWKLRFLFWRLLWRCLFLLFLVVLGIIISNVKLTIVWEKMKYISPKKTIHLITLHLYILYLLNIQLEKKKAPIRSRALTNHGWTKIKYSLKRYILKIVQTDGQNYGLALILISKKFVYPKK